MFNFDDEDDYDNPFCAVVTFNIHRPGVPINEHASLSMRGDAVDNLDDMLDFMTRALNACGFTYVDGLLVDNGF